MGDQVQAPSEANAAAITSRIYEGYLRDRLSQVEVPTLQLQRDLWLSRATLRNDTRRVSHNPILSYVPIHF